MSRIPIGIITENQTFDEYLNLRQINSYFPVEIIFENIGDTLEQTLLESVNKIEEAVKRLHMKGVRNFIISQSSILIINWVLGEGIIGNEGIYCDKIERWQDSRFFCTYNSLSYEGNTSNLLLVVNNLYRFADVESGRQDSDIIEIFINELYKNLQLPQRIYNIIQVGDNASESTSKTLSEACKILNINFINIPVRLIQDPDPIKQDIFGGLYEFIDGSESILNLWVRTLNTTDETSALSVAVNGGFIDAFTNTLLNTNLNLLNIETNIPVNATLYQTLNDTVGNTSIYGGDQLFLSSRNLRNRFLTTNYSYREIETLPPKDKNHPLDIAQYKPTFSTRTVFNPILTKVSGFLPGNDGTLRPLANIEIVEYILSTMAGTFDVFNGVQDNRFRFDLRTHKSRISALIEYFIIPANTFVDESKGLRLNKNFDP